MSDPVPTFAGWYPDTANTGGTRYWDGSRWTGDTRPQRKSFAADSGHRSEGWSVIGFGGIFWFVLLMAMFEEASVGSAVAFIAMTILGLPIAAAFGFYLLRGQGPTTAAVEQRLVEERKAAKSKRLKADLAGAAATIGRFGRPQAPAPSMGNEGAVAAQVDAISDPETARALQNLQNLLYTRTITDAEFSAAKDKLFGAVELADQFGQIEKLAELHRAGILGDVEFAAAKARVLGL